MSLASSRAPERVTWVIISLISTPSVPLYQFVDADRVSTDNRCCFPGSVFDQDTARLAALCPSRAAPLLQYKRPA
ncbi:hypothetical protein EXIGLDRAFT_760788 [Exidia glandulosa HHB12029]|uniref:Uncharacterized protein n=1 Tax=Exidia glandulosa HHB12029 TaxID=1314781 RepID=A0A165P3C9_EXIGL|nr:hypothetical protein EXIGLDRAFT_760788 [Exidia glandulosa HHB12029]